MYDHNNIIIIIQAREYCCLGHVMSLWETISVELARQLYLTGQVFNVQYCHSNVAWLLAYQARPLFRMWRPLPTDLYKGRRGRKKVYIRSLIDYLVIYCISFFFSITGAVWLCRWKVPWATGTRRQRCSGKVPEALWSRLPLGNTLWVHWDSRKTFTKWRAEMAVSVTIMTTTIIYNFFF